MKGKIHSFESFGTVDGPGIRFVVFMAGCPLRCRYCHNIDVVLAKGADEFTPKQVLEKVLRAKEYFESSGGGVTFSGGEPMMQPDFLAECLRLCREAGIHTAVDTSLYTSQEALEKIIPFTDLFLVSLKHFNDKEHRKLTNVGNKLILENLKWLSSQNKRIWLRFVVLPGLSDTKGNVEALIDFCRGIEFEKLELLPYHQMGVAKWGKLGLEYELEDATVPTGDEVKQLAERLEKEGIEVVTTES